jgi:hypothetical protein
VIAGLALAPYAQRVGDTLVCAGSLAILCVNVVSTEFAPVRR